LIALPWVVLSWKALTAPPSDRDIPSGTACRQVVVFRRQPFGIA